MSFRGSSGLDSLLKNFLSRNPQYDIEAYAFVLDALSFTLGKLKEPRHLTAAELLEGIRKYTIKMFGPMAKTVLEFWKVKSCEDFGEIVFHLVSLGLIRKRESDTKTDFKGGYDFAEAFEKPFKI